MNVGTGLQLTSMNRLCYIFVSQLLVRSSENTEVKLSFLL